MRPGIGASARKLNNKSENAGSMRAHHHTIRLSRRLKHRIKGTAAPKGALLCPTWPDCSTLRIKITRSAHGLDQFRLCRVRLQSATKAGYTAVDTPVERIVAARRGEIKDFVTGENLECVAKTATRSSSIGVSGTSAPCTSVRLLAF
jgi:hypothetical protein